jgi:large subunit ribosomal protein L35e
LLIRFASFVRSFLSLAFLPFQSKLAALYKDDKYKPLDLRTKGTRAWRRRLSPEDAKLTTLKQQKKQAHFGTRMYALKA